MNREVLKVADMADEFGVKKRTIWAWNNKGLLPNPIKINGRIIGWRKSDIDKFLEEATSN